MLLLIAGHLRSPCHCTAAALNDALLQLQARPGCEQNSQTVCLKNHKAVSSVLDSTTSARNEILLSQKKPSNMKTGRQQWQAHPLPFSFQTTWGPGALLRQAPSHPSSPSLPFPGAWAVFLRGTKGQPAVPGHTEEAVVSGAVVLRPSSRCLQAWALQPPHPASTPRLLPPALFHCCSSWRDGREGSSADEADSFKPF